MGEFVGTGLLNLDKVFGFPLGSSVFMTVNPLLVVGNQAYGTANHAKGVRIVAPKSGTIKGLTYWVSTASGNFEMFILDTNSGTNRNVLWASGSVAVGTAGTWQTPIDTTLDVVQGQHFDVCLSFDNITAQILRQTIGGGPQILPTGYPTLSPNGGTNKLLWDAAVTVPIGGAGATITQSTMNSTSVCPLLSGYIA
jgi:hypothetical protein